MGNRAVITTEHRDIGLYLHWNGGRDSVNGFLAYCNMKGYRCPERDDYGWISLSTIVGNFMGAGMSAGIGPYNNQDRDNGDNGVYIIENWNVVGRIYYSPEEEQNEYDLYDFMVAINERMPKNLQESEDKIRVWVSEHGKEYGWDINLMEEDPDKKLKWLEDITMNEEGNWYWWYVGKIDGITGTVFTQKKSKLDEYQYGVCVKAADGTQEHEIIEKIKEAIKNE